MTTPPVPNILLGPQTLYDDFSTNTIDTPSDLSHIWNPAPRGFTSMGARYLTSTHDDQCYCEPSFPGVAQCDNAGTFVSPALDANGMPQTIYGRPGWSGNPPAWTQFGKTPLGINPFSPAPGGGLRITITKANAGAKGWMWNRSWTSGELQTNPAFGGAGFIQQYGLIEACFTAPTGPGMWPAFWLMPANGAWPPEIDIVEILGADPITAYGTLHSKLYGSPSYRQVLVQGPNLGLKPHVYGILWTPTDFIYMLDGLEYGRIPNNGDFNQPFYLMLNCTVGGTDKYGTSWGGAWTTATPDPSYMDIQYVRCFAYDPALVLPPAPIDLGYGTGGGPPAVGGRTGVMVLSDGSQFTLDEVIGGIFRNAPPGHMPDPDD